MRRKRDGDLGLIERDTMPRVVVNGQERSRSQQQTDNQRNEIGGLHEMVPGVHGVQCCAPTPDQQTRCLNDA